MGWVSRCTCAGERPRTPSWRRCVRRGKSLRCGTLQVRALPFTLGCCGALPPPGVEAQNRRAGGGGRGSG
eukprot:11637752-Prorocentrum_lima.AAC.1